MGKEILNKFKDRENIEIINLNSNRYKEHIPGDDLFS